VENTASSGGDAIYFYTYGTVNVRGGTVISTNGNAIYRYWGLNGGTVNVLGGTVTATNGYSVYLADNGLSLTLGGNPTITGRIYTYPEKLGVITAVTDKFAPTLGKVYTLDFPTAEYKVDKTTVINGRDFLNNFELFYYSDKKFALIASAANLIISNALDVSFDLNGSTGTTPNPVRVINNGKVSENKKPSTNGYIKAGYINGGKWCTTAACTTEFIFGESGTAITQDITLYLKWIPVFNITFNANGGTVSPTSGTTIADSTLASLPTPTRNGYTFNGWFTATTGGTQVTTSRKYSASTTIYAQWTLITYTVTFNPNNGTVSPASGTTGVGGVFTSLPTPTRDGYAFNGWFTAATGGTEVTTSRVYTANTTIYAQWSPAYTVTFDANEGTVNPTSSMTGAYSKLTLLPTPTRAGHAFNGWFTAATGGTQVTTNTVFSTSTTIYAQWKSASIVTFDANGGTVSLAVDATGEDLKLASLPTPSRGTYFSFNGWFTTATGGTQVTTSTVFNTSTTIYAQWTPLYAVTFDANGGTLPNGTLSTLSESFENGANGWVLVNGSQTNKWVIGTDTKNSGSYSAYITNTTSPTASSPNSYTVGSYSNVHLYKDITFPESNSDFTLTFYFKGNGSPNYDYMTVRYGDISSTPVAGSAFSAGTQLGTSYYSNSNWSQKTINLPAATFSGKTIRLVFSWINNNYSGGVQPPAAIDDISITSITTTTTTVSMTGTNGRFALLPTPTRAPYTFSGWFTAATGGTQVTTNTVFNANTTLYARWTIDTRAVTFDANNGMLPNFSESFENGANSWVLVNGSQTNKWVIGTATSYSGSYSAYITNDASPTASSPNSYTTTSASVVHLYKDITFPASSSDFTLTFYFKGYGESSYDDLSFRYSTTSYTPVAGSTFSSGTQLGTNYYGNSNWSQKTITLPAATFSGKTMRLVFSWRNNASGGTQPPAAIDNINIPGVTTPTLTTNTSGGTLAPLPTPARDGYAFNGWFTATTGGTEVTTSTVFSANTTIYARWMSIYNVTFNANGGTLPQFPESFENGANGWVLVNGSQTNKWVIGTATRYSGSYSAYITDAASPTASSPNSYNISSTSVVHLYKNVTFPVSSSDFTLTFYFKGYGESGYDDLSFRYSTTSYTPVAGSAFTDGTKLGDNYFNNSSWTQKSITLPAATFSGKTMRLVFSWKNDASAGTQPPAAIDDINISGINPAYTGERGKLASLPTPTKSGYAFDGWFTATTGGTEVTTSTVFGANATVYAQWTPIYTVTFNANGGSVSPTNRETATYGKLASLPTPTRANYAFDGWFTEETGGTEVTTGTVFGANATIYAKWTPIYAVFFDANDGLVSPTFNYTATHGKLASLPTPTRTGYAFDGWFTTLTGGEEVTTNTVFSQTGTTIYAKWTPIYTVTFNANGGTVSPASGATGAGGKFVSLPTPTRHGYAFDGWFNSATGGTQVTTNTVFNTNATVYAQWTLIYAITFDANSGTVTPGIGMTGAGGKFASLPTPTKYGYVFDGWFTEKTGGEKITESTVFSSSSTIYAHWTIITYTVTLNANGGEVTSESGTTGEGWMLNLLPTPTRIGYTFTGWYTATTGGTQVTANTVYNADITIYARWSIITYTVTFNANGGTVSPTSRVTGEGWALASLPTPTRENYAFNGWFTAATGGTVITTSTAFGANATIYAQWTPIYLVFLDANGGSVSPTTRETAAYGKLASLPTPTRDSYAFNGWFTAATDGTEVTTNTMFGQNGTTIYAQWTPTYTITFNANGGSVNPTTRATVAYGKLASLPTPTRTGYTFDGWFTAVTGGENVTESAIFSSDSTIYAHWTIITYTVTFNANDGEVTPESGMTGEGWKLASLPTPMKTGFTFAGWFTAVTGGTQVTTSTVFNANTTIYARWTITVTFNANGGTVTPASSTTNTSWKLASLPTPTRTGYTFGGWFTEETGGTQITTNTEFSENTTVYARWTSTTYTITYNLNSGTNDASNPTSYTIESSDITLDSPTRNGYTFGGWYSNSSLTGDAITSISVGSTGNKTYWAKWTLITYAITFNANGGTVTTASSTTGTGQKLTSLPTPTRTGYTFGGWFTEETEGTQVTTSTEFSENTTVYAHWALNTYAVTFNANGGNVLSTSNFTESFEDGTTGWNIVNGSQTNKWVIGTATSRTGSYSAYISNDGSTNSYNTSSTSVVHLYRDITFPVSSSDFTLTFYFKGNGESGYDDLSFRYSTTSYTPVAGSTFSSGTQLGTNYVNNSSWTQKTITLPAATFSGKTMRLVFSWRNDNSAGTQSPAAIDDISITGVVPNAITGEGWKLASLPTPTRDGYRFDGWFTASTGGTEVTTDYVFSTNTTIYAHWTFISYIVTFNANGGTVTTTSSTTNTNWRLSSLPTPTRTGYTFNGWFTEETGGTQITTSTVFNMDSTVYARWTPIMYTITYYLNGGTNHESNPMNYTVDSSDIVLNSPTKYGYIFGGWYNNSYFFAEDSIISISAGSTGNKTYWAKWTSITYTVTFNANGGTVTTTSSTTNTSWRLIYLPTPTRTGYTFGGWFTEETGGVQVTTSTVFNTDSTVYARWTLWMTQEEICLTEGKLWKNGECRTAETPIISAVNQMQILAHATGNAITLQNLPANAKVDVYNVQGKRVYSNRANPSIGGIGVQTIDVHAKGVYIVKVSRGVSNTPSNVFRVAVR
jgi:uncharacterized repeat protein (TIGR02543 family)